jgi:hypothetical protein
MQLVSVLYPFSVQGSPAVVGSSQYHPSHGHLESVDRLHCPSLHVHLQSSPVSHSQQHVVGAAVVVVGSGVVVVVVGSD